MPSMVDVLARHLMLGSLLDELRRHSGDYQIVEHWQQGEFHHDVVLRVPALAAELGGEVLIVATNCNGGVKEVLSFSDVPSHSALWHSRCPENPDFDGALTGLVAAARTEHWFDPCELLSPEARSELREEFRERQCGGGWLPKRSAAP
jgi:hypothetical protein